MTETVTVRLDANDKEAIQRIADEMSEQTGVRIYPASIVRAAIVTYITLNDPKPAKKGTR